MRLFLALMDQIFIIYISAQPHLVREVFSGHFLKYISTPIHGSGLKSHVCFNNI